MKRPLDVMHIIEKNRLHTGSVVQMMEAATGLARRGHRISVVSRPGGDLQDCCADASLAFVASPLRHPFDLVSAWRLRQVLRRGRTDVMHVHKGRAHAIALLAAAGLGPRPKIVVNRGVSFALDRFNRGKYHHRRVAAVVCVAEAVRKIVISSAGLPPEMVHTVHSATDLARFDPQRVDHQRLRSELGLGPEHLLVAQVSVRGWKGWQDLLAGVAELAPLHDHLRLLLVGCEPDRRRRQVVAAAAALGMRDRLLTLPFRRDMPEVLAACDVVVDASRKGSGITGTIREAMALGRAVVATDCAGNAELVEHARSGVLVPIADVGALAAAIGDLLGDHETRSRLGAAARQRVVENFSLEHKLDRLEELYRSIARPA